MADSDAGPSGGNLAATNAGTDAEQLKTLKTQLARVLRAGAWSSVTLVAIGLTVVLARGEEHSAFRRAQPAGQALFHEPGIAVVSLGMIVLVATPVLRELTAAAVFARHHDRTYLALTTVVLFLVVAALVVGAR
jgi:uncharacterized membrane protein